MQDLAVEYVALDSILPYARNAREHGEEQVSELAGIINSFGFRFPVAIDADGVLIAGHGRVLAAHRLKLERVPAIRHHDLTPTQVQALRLIDNQLAARSDWNPDMLKLEMQELSLAGFAMPMLGFGAALAGLLAPAAPEPNAGNGDPDDVPEPPKETRSRPGDLWLLGEHRLLCGDSTNAADLDALMRGEKAAIVLTDPPYGISYQSNFRISKFDKIENDDVVLDEWIGLAAAHSSSWVIFFCAWQRLADWLHAGAAFGKLTNMLIWRKHAAMGDLQGQFAPTFEVALAYNRGGKLRAGVRKSAVFEHGIEHASTFQHPTQKPAALLVDILEGLPLGSVLDPFLGSGTTLMACEQTGRRCYGLELEPRYCDVIVSRWEKFTGRQAELAPDSEAAAAASAPGAAATPSA